MRPQLEPLPDRILPDITPPPLPLPLIPPPGITPPLVLNPPVVAIVGGPGGFVLSPRDPLSLRIAFPVNLGLGLLPLAPPVAPFPGSIAP